mmetsp:Transcript_10612/g.20485  ORF Transcript_10612/g.20485 Transcript_10612/m.20485 type:complete len:647 (+) Transcript_10612:3229-5169(+)
MENHKFIANTSGLCDVCSRSRDQCMRRFNKQREAEDLQIISAVVFYQQIPETCRVQQIACTTLNTFLLSNSGQIFSWGDVSFALGREVPHRRDAARPGLIERLRNCFVQSIATGDNHVITLNSDNIVHTWGTNECGQLGIGMYEDQPLPIMVLTLKQVKIVKICAGPQTSFATAAGGELYVWGSNEDGQLGAENVGTGYRGKEDNARALEENKANIHTPLQLQTHKIWKPFPELEVLNDSRKKTFFYRSIMDQEVTPDGINRREFNLVCSENEDLKRRLRTVLEKQTNIEKSLFSHEPIENSASSDSLLENFRIFYKEAEDEKEALETNIRELEQKYKAARDLSKVLVKEIKGREELFLNKKIELQQCEHQVKELIVQQEMSSSGSSSSLKMKKDRLKELNDSLNTLGKERAEKHSALSSNEGTILSILKSIEERKEELQKKQHTINVYKEIIDTRNEQLKRDYLENNQKAVERDILALIMINETIEDTALANLSKSVPPTGLINLAETSRNIMSRVEFEIASMEKPSTLPMFEMLNEIWAIVAENLVLRKDLNELTEGLSIKLAENLSMYYTDDVKKFSPMRMFSDNLESEDTNLDTAHDGGELALMGISLDDEEPTSGRQKAPKKQNFIKVEEEEDDEEETLGS